jgi:hypothetical protein
MSFASPALLWLMALGAPLLAIYLLKVRPRRQPTTALFLWRAVLTQRQTSSLFQRLRELWSLLLMLLVLSALTLSVAGLRFGDDERKDLLIILDTSASMQSVDAGKSRIDRARQAAHDLVAGMSGDQRAAVATLDRELRYRCHLTGSRRDLLAAIDAVAAGPLGFSSTPLRTLNDPEAPWQDRYRCVLITDACDFGDELPAEPLEIVQIADGATNIGIVAADLQRLPDGRVALFYRLRSTAAEPVEVELQLAFAQPGAVRRLIPVTVQPGVNPAETFELDTAEAGAWFLRLNRPDGLAVDDIAYLALPPRRPVAVAVRSEAPFFLQRCIEAFAARGDLLRLDADKPSLVLTDAGSPSEPRAMILHPSGDSPWWSELGEPLDDIVPTVVDAQHPLLHHLDVDVVSFHGARRLVAPPMAEVIVRAAADGTPLLYRVRNGEQQAVVLNVDPLAGDFYLSTAFPILVHDAAMVLAGRGERPAGTLAVGSALPSPLSGGHITAPNGSVVLTPALAQQCGHYQLSGGDDERTIGVSLIDSAESAITTTAGRERLRPISRGEPPATWLTLLAVLTLVGECLLYHRRMAG